MINASLMNNDNQTEDSSAQQYDTQSANPNITDQEGHYNALPEEVKNSIVFRANLEYKEPWQIR